MATIELGGMAIPDSALTWMFVRASGPGGQHVNKVSTAVECRLHLDRAGIGGGTRERLEKLAGSRLTGGGEVRVFVDRHRAQARNRAIALERLAALIAAARQEPKRRVPTKPSAAQKARRREDKKRRSEIKKRRRAPDAY